MKNIWKKAVVALSLTVGMAAGVAMANKGGGQPVELAACCSQCQPKYTYCMSFCELNDLNCKEICQHARELCYDSCTEC